VKDNPNEEQGGEVDISAKQHTSVMCTDM